MEKSCVLSACLFTFSNFLFLIFFYREYQYNKEGGFSYPSMLQLDPYYILQTWRHRFQDANLTSWAYLLNALAWFSMVIPITQLAYILSNGGKRKPVMHAYLVLLVFTGSFTEFLSRLIMSGIEDSTRHLILHFNLDDWETAYDGETDGMGWRVLEVIHNIARGFVLWIDSFEWIILFQIMIIIHYSISSKKWGYFGLIIAAFSLLDFAASILRLHSWVRWSSVTFITTLFNRVVLIPIWLLKLGNQLPGASKTFGNQESNQVASTPSPVSTSDSTTVSTPLATPATAPVLNGDHPIS